LISGGASAYAPFEGFRFQVTSPDANAPEGAWTRDIYAIADRR